MSSTRNAYDLAWQFSSAIEQANVLSEEYRLGTPDASSDIDSRLCWTSPHPYIQALELHDTPALCIHAFVCPKPEFVALFEQDTGIAVSKTDTGMLCIKHISYADVLTALERCVRRASDSRGKTLYLSDLMERSRDNCPGAPIKLTRDIH